MDKEIVVATAIASKSTAATSSLLTSMVIFNDPAYIIIAGLGAFVSMGSAHYDFTMEKRRNEKKGKVFLKQMHLELTKAFIVGAIFTVLSFMLLVQVGGEVMKNFINVDWFDKMLPSFWLIFTVALSTESVNIWNWGKSKLGGKINEDSK